MIITKEMKKEFFLRCAKLAAIKALKRASLK